MRACGGAAAPRRAALLVFTDETDAAYITAVVRALAALPRWGGGVWHGDPLVAAQLGEQDQQASAAGPRSSKGKHTHRAPRPSTPPCPPKETTPRVLMARRALLEPCPLVL